MHFNYVEYEHFIHCLAQHNKHKYKVFRENSVSEVIENRYLGFNAVNVNYKYDEGTDENGEGSTSEHHTHIDDGFQLFLLNVLLFLLLITFPLFPFVEL